MKRYFFPVAMAGFLLCAFSGAVFADPAVSVGWLERLKNPATRAEQEWNLRLEKDSAKVPALVSLLRAPDAGLKVTVLQILSESGVHTIWRDVAALLKDSDIRVREAAAGALGAFGERGAIPFLMESIREGMGLGDAAVYWIMPSDITENFRYACVEAINRLAKQDFKYTRAQNNFGRLYWLKQIDAWWRQQQVFYSPAFQGQAKAWQSLKVQIEQLQALITQAVADDVLGAPELERYLKDLKEHVEAIAKTVESPNPSAAEMQEHSAAIRKSIGTVDEVFVYARDLESASRAWKGVQSALTHSLRKNEAFLLKK